MKVALKTREFERDRDYDWDDYFPSDKMLSAEAGKLHRAMEGVYKDRYFVAIFREGVGKDVTLCVSVATTRSDAPGRPIRTIAECLAESRVEGRLLMAFFAECLNRPDGETLYDPESCIAKAVESLYQTKRPDEFIRFCKKLKHVGGDGVLPKDRFAFPRNDMKERVSLMSSLPAVLASDSPFLFALVDRRPADVLGSLGSMFDKAAVRIFSEATTQKETLQTPQAEEGAGAPQKYLKAAAIGGAVILAILVAAIGPCRRGEEGNKTDGGEVLVCGSGAGREYSSNIVESAGSGKSVGQARGVGVCTNAITAIAEAQKTEVTLSIATNAVTQVTNSIPVNTNAAHNAATPQGNVPRKDNP